MKTRIGKITEKEKKEIQLLFERKNGLNELIKEISPDNNLLYNKIVADMGKTKINFDNWWDKMSKKYNWKSCKNGHWEINFETCEILLVKQDK